MTSRLSSLWSRLTGRAPDAVRPPIFGGAADPNARAPSEPAAASEPKPPVNELRFVVNREVEAKVEAALDDESAWGIYGDWLQSQADGRGELVALMGQNLDTEAAQYLAANYTELFGSVARYTGWAEKRKAAPPLVRYQVKRKPEEPLRFRRTQASGPPEMLRDLQWNHGFLARVSIDPQPEEMLSLLLRRPVCRFLLELGIVVEPHAAERFPNLYPLIAELAPPTLKRLVVGDFVYPEECEMSWAELGDVSAVWKLTQLEALTICGGMAELGEVEAGHLIAFSRESGGLAREELEAITKASWPRLERLELWLGNENYGGTCTIDDLKPVLEGTRFPALKDLGLKNNELTDALVFALADSRILPRLRTLDLSMGTLGREGADTLVRRAEAFAHLTVLHLDDNYLPADCLDALKAAIPHVTGLEDQTKALDADDEEDFRYCTVSE
jgi:hypothetical protein